MFGRTLSMLLLLMALNLPQARPIIIDTMYGKIQGFEMTTADGAKANVFLGVPYARPPIGELRFQPPQQNEPWSHILNVSELKPMCMQTFYENESEDCLYMNIYVPTKLTRRKLHPVLLWIHGGSFILGSGNYFHVDGTIDNLVDRGLIFVSVNYRLGFWGFSSLLNKSMPGNLGLRDQISALQWIRANIRSFNGDPKSVTVAGDSAGAVSASILAISPLAK
uniref:Carboxylesterase type B domain-containing protein n=1 Tax=Romanomermis culicivorax TaxID=13658 RepID=A0A915ING2_ROMCU